VTLSFVPFEKEDPRAWSAFVDSCDEAWLPHRPEFLAASPEDCSFSLRRNGELIGVCALARQRQGRAAAVLYGAGLALASTVAFHDIVDDFRAELHALVARQGALAVQFNQPPLSPALAGRRYADSILMELGFSCGLRWGFNLDYVTGFHTVIELSHEMGAILKGFTKGNRACVARCRRLAATAEFSDAARFSDGHWDAFVNIHRATYARTGAAAFSEEHLARLKRHAQAGFIALAALRLDGELVAAILLETYKGGANYLAGGCRDDAQKLGAMVYLHFLAMERMKLAGYRYYCMGPSFPALRGTKMGAIGDFKRRFGGAKWDILAGELVTDRRLYWRRILLPRAVKFIGARGFLPSGLARMWNRLRNRGAA